MAAYLSGEFDFQAFSDNGTPLVGGRLYTYAYGTTTRKIAYTDAAGTVPHTYTSDGVGGQYIALNARGELPAPLYLTAGSYDIALKRADGSTVWTRRADPVGDVAALTADLASTASGKGGALVGLADTQSVTVQDIAITAATEVNVLRYIPPAQWAAILAGTSTYDAKSAIQSAIDSGKPLYAPGVYKIVGSLDLSKLSTLRGDAYTGGGDTGSAFIFYNVGTAAALSMPTTKTKVFSHIQDMAFRASSWDAVTGANGHGMDIAGQLSLTRVQVIGFKKIGIYLHHDATAVGPYESTLTNVRALYSGQHGIVVGRGANSLTLIQPECKWNGAPTFLTAPSAVGIYDGLYVDNYDDGSGWPTYLPEGLTLIGGDASYNSRYGWNIQGVSYGRIMPGYAEFNKASFDANLGLDLQNSFVQFGRVPAAKVNLAATFATYQRTNQVYIGGKSYGAGNTNTAPQNSFSGTNLTQILSENSAGTNQIYMLPDPATGNLTIGQTGSGVLTIGAGASIALPLNANVQFSGVNTTGAGSAALGSNCPATTLTAPYKWVRVLASDGSVCFMPIWK